MVMACLARHQTKVTLRSLTNEAGRTFEHNVSLESCGSPSRHGKSNLAVGSISVQPGGPGDRYLVPDLALGDVVVSSLTRTHRAHQLVAYVLLILL